jgi:hypothetical protein
MANVQADISITVSNPNAPLALNVDNVPDTAEIGTPYDGQIVASGGTPPYTFEVSTGALPDGLEGAPDGTNPAAWDISGTPVQDPNETYPFDDDFVVTCTDSAGAQASARIGNRTGKTNLPATKTPAKK